MSITNKDDMDITDAEDSLGTEPLLRFLRDVSRSMLERHCNAPVYVTRMKDLSSFLVKSSFYWSHSHSRTHSSLSAWLILK